jgi:hypothetical protein
MRVFIVDKEPNDQSVLARALAKSKDIQAFDSAENRPREPSFVWANFSPPVAPHLERSGRRGCSSLGRPCKKV